MSKTYLKDKIVRNTEKININIPSINNTIVHAEESNKLINDHIDINQKITDELNNKKKMIASHERMLQTSQDKNIYKEKLMYSYISLIISIIVVLLVSYSYSYFI